MTPSYPRFSFEHRIVAAIVKGIIQQAELYFTAIGTTLETANDGCTISDDALMLCHFLESGNSSINQLREYLNSMIRIAASARERSSAAKDQFRMIRRELNKVGNVIPSRLHIFIHRIFRFAVICLTRSPRFRQSKGPDSENPTSRMGSIPALSRCRHTQAIQLAWIMTGLGITNRNFVSIFTCPTDHIIKLPCRLLAPEHHMKSFTDVLDDLQQANKVIGQLIKHIGGFSDWWLSAETKKGSPLNAKISVTYPLFFLQIDRASVFNWPAYPRWYQPLTKFECSKKMDGRQSAVYLVLSGGNVYLSIAITYVLTDFF
jgi:hypothetical protein